MQESATTSPSITLVLRTEEGVNLFYVVELEDKNETYQIYTSENYMSALIAARKVFSKIKTQSSDFGVMLESPQGKGISYTLGSFEVGDFEDSSVFYDELVNDFESAKLSNKSSNEIFRSLINKNKLNEYQEQRLLKKIKELSI